MREIIFRQLAIFRYRLNLRQASLGTISHRNGHGADLLAGHQEVNE